MDAPVAAHAAGMRERPETAYKPYTGKVRRVKSFTGCWGCRSRKVKVGFQLAIGLKPSNLPLTMQCDETSPQCKKCLKLGLVCQGYRPDYIWVTSDQKTYQPGRRRALETHLTWHGYPTWDSAYIDKLIGQCDIEAEEAREHGSIYLAGYEKLAGPFSVFACYGYDSTITSGRENWATPLSYHNVVTIRFARSSYLLHHYVKYVALSMMPFKDIRNPWQSFYPLTASCGDTDAHMSLFHAILAQSAGNLACLGSERMEMLNLSLYHYSQALRRLRKSLQQDKKDVGIILAIILTLIMAEVRSYVPLRNKESFNHAQVYGGNSVAWRQHLKGGWEFLKSYQAVQPWLESDFAWMASQSLCLLKIRADTMSISNHSTSNTRKREIDYMEESLIASVATRHDFGFTVGANQTFIACIQDIARLKARLQTEGCTTVVEEDIRHLYQRLSNSLFETTEMQTNPIVECHHRIFHAGIMIYFYRNLWNLPPCEISDCLRMIFDQVVTYKNLGGTHITLWPMFIAAVEAYEERHLEIMEAWLNAEEQIGVANRQQVKAFIERVWSLRSNTAKIMGLDKGTVLVDWVDMMQEWNMDILLV
ncbi:hypothetical protein BP6252_13622 [Coleophoma cylindrospora]|uniref:Zn(2)-C6 fungal-type domain-containing protein n=1 Tax=Coleophoma cylindrospora TaxID=1849047 RepID=A0A3D8Q8U1_9HELO|nr:hypothetical protein BP6252_13622 [Coleophoma cylindrospora]